MLLDGSVIKVGGIVYGTVLPDANVGVCEKHIVGMLMYDLDNDIKVYNTNGILLMNVCGHAIERVMYV